MPMSAPQRRPVAGPETPPRLRKGERKRQLLGHARDLLAAHGYQGLTLERLAEVAGVSLGIVKRHFDSKKAVFGEWLAGLCRATFQRWQTETAGLSDPLAKVHAVIEMYLTATREQAVDYRILHRALLDDTAAEVLDLVQAFYLDGETLLAQIIGEGQQSGVFRRSLDPDPAGGDATAGRGRLPAAGHRLPPALPAQDGRVSPLLVPTRPASSDHEDT
jgi:AcrR family transcriptional regulator